MVKVIRWHGMRDEPSSEGFSMETPIVMRDCGRVRGRDQARTMGLGGRSSR